MNINPAEDGRLRSNALLSYSPAINNIERSHSVTGATFEDRDGPFHHSVEYSSLKRERDGVIAKRDTRDAIEWRMKDRLKTVSGLLCVCLNIGVDPPDAEMPIRPEPCARRQCFIDPFKLSAQKSLQLIGKALLSQYEAIQPRARYKLALDPTADEIKRNLLALRRSAKDERVLFHYNGHGVPRPTSSNELWVFNKNYTQYIPVSIHDIKSWIGSPAIYVFDCFSAEGLLPASSRSKEFYLASCRTKETLPLNPELPADLFTSCLTAPIETSLLIFALNNRRLLSPDIDYMKYIDRVPGKIQDRKTPVGELYWIFTAITDTIAFCWLPLDIFKLLFRQDLMVAALFRNFLLSQWILNKYDCHPVSRPVVPSMVSHELWSNWEFELERLLLQLPHLVPEEEDLRDPLAEDVAKATPTYDADKYEHSTFFADQLASFETWLGTMPHRTPPTHIPIILQVLLSQQFRLRALVLLCRFLNLDRDAVDHALSVGIFPYILKLLQSPSSELRLPLVFIWSRIVLTHPESAGDLSKEKGYRYFTSILFEKSADVEITDEIRTMCYFILYRYCDYGAQELVKSGLQFSIVAHMTSEDDNLRKWSMLCYLKLYMLFDFERNDVVESLQHNLYHRDPVLRACAIRITSKTLRSSSTTERLIANCLSAINDASVLVRKELVHLMFQAAIERSDSFTQAMTDYWDQIGSSGTVRKQGFGGDSFYLCIWKLLLSLKGDPDLDVGNESAKVVDALLSKWRTESLLQKPEPDLSELESLSLNNLLGIARETSEPAEVRAVQLGTSSRTFSLNLQQTIHAGLESVALIDNYNGRYFITDGKKTVLPFLGIDSDLSARVPWGESIDIPLHPKFRITALEAKIQNFDGCLVGAEDGSCWIYGAGDGKINYVSAFRCLPEVVPGNYDSGLYMSWMSMDHQLACAGSCRQCRIWDLNTELVSRSFHIGADFCTILRTSKYHAGRILVGDGDGCVRLHDKNIPSSGQATCKVGHSAIVGLFEMSPSQIWHVNSAGKVAIWDIVAGKTRTSNLFTTGEAIVCTSFSDSMGLLAVATSRRSLELFRTSLERQNPVTHVATLRGRDSFLSSKVNVINSICFDSQKELLVVGGNDLSVYGR